MEQRKPRTNGERRPRRNGQRRNAPRREEK